LDAARRILQNISHRSSYLDLDFTKGEYMELTHHGSVRSRWIIGGALVAVGVALFLMNIGVIARVHVWNYWPLIFVVMGATKLTAPYKRSEGFFWLALGAWFLVSTLRLWDLRWRETWPAILVILGIRWMWESVEREKLRTARMSSQQQHVSLH
jgi:hypothetical protein